MTTFLENENRTWRQATQEVELAAEAALIATNSP